MKGKDFVFTSLQSWDTSIGSTVREIATEVSKNNRVIFLNSPLDLLTYYGKEDKPETQIRRKVVKEGRHLLRKIHDNLWLLDFPFTVLPIQFLPDGFLFDTANRINNKKIYSYARKVIRELGFKDYTLFMDNDIYRSFYAKEYLQPRTSILYYRDHLLGPYWKHHAPRVRPELCMKSDLVLTNSEYFRDLLGPYNEKTYFVGQGVNLDQYDIHESRPVPTDLDSIPRPLIGYTGYITAIRLDADLMYETAQARPQYSFVLVGKEDDFFQAHPIHELKNVYFLGEKPYKEVSAYIQAFDVCLNPQIINKVTDGNWPLKIDEYLALGKPTVATRTGFMKIFGNTVWTCLGAGEYVVAIDEALTRNSEEDIKERVAMAESHSWENCVKRIYSHIP